MLRTAFVPGIPRGGERASTLLLQNTLHALDRISLPIEEMFDRAQNRYIAGTIIASASRALQRLDLRKAGLPESQHMPRQFKLPGDLADRAKRIGAFVHPPLAPYFKLQAGHLDRWPLAGSRAGAILARINFPCQKPQKCSVVLFIGNRQTIDPGLEHIRWLEHHDAALGYRNLDPGLGIAPNALRLGAHEKPPKRRQFDGFAPDQSVGEFIQHRLHQNSRLLARQTDTTVH